MTIIQLRRATAASWTSVNPILALGEVGIETDTYKFKVGDGTSLWAALPYFVTASSIGLGNVNNTSDATKNAATAALTNKDLTSGTNTFPTSLVTLTGSQSLSNKTLTAPTVTDYTETVNAIGTVSSSSTLSLSSGTVLTATLTASAACTFTMPTAAAGKSFVLMLKQAASTGNGSATFTNVKWSGGTAPTITAAAGKMDILSFFSDGTNWYGSITQNYTP